MPGGKLENQGSGKHFVFPTRISTEREGRRQAAENEREQFMCSVQFCPVGDTVKAMADVDDPVLSQERAAKETALLGLLCDLYPLIVALWVVAFLKGAKMFKYKKSKNTTHKFTTLLFCSYQLLVHFCFNVSGEG